MTEREILVEPNVDQEVSGTILVVDDDARSRLLLQDFLTAKGYQVHTAENGEQGLRQARRDPPDLVLLDVMMPDIDGFQICRRLKSDPKTRSVPVLLVTALSEREDRLAGIDAGAGDFITKPVDLPELVLRVRNAVYSKHLYDQVQRNYARLKELEAFRDSLTNMVVHDMNQHITAIGGYMQLLQFSPEPSKTEIEECIAPALGAVRVLGGMVRSLLDISRLEEGKLQPQLASHNVHEVIAKAVLALGPGNNGRSIRTEPEVGKIDATFDRDLIGRVIIKLIGNAVKFTPENGDIRVSVSRQAGDVRISVSDTGPGILAEYREKIFEKFWHAQSPKLSKKISTGLGLTFCKLAVEAHGGAIGVDSEPGEGSTFWFTLPGEPARMALPEGSPHYADGVGGGNGRKAPSPEVLANAREDGNRVTANSRDSDSPSRHADRPGNAVSRQRRG